MREELLFQRFLEFLREDLPNGDVTSELVLDENQRAEALFISKDHGILSGIELICYFLEKLGLEAENMKPSGAEISEGDVLMRAAGNARLILSVERTSLNLLSHLSGIATETRKLVDKASRHGVRIAATRKTLPGLREFEKLAVVHGGGDPHRFSLSDMILIKDNHKKLAGGIERAIKNARAASFSVKIEVEVENAEEALIAAREGVDIIMLDNFTPSVIKETVQRLKEAGLRDRVTLEASGGITPDNIEDYLTTGIDVISVGYITKSARSLDISLEIVA